MLFGNKKCENCGSNYDKALDTCPACGTRDANFESYGVPKHMVWLSTWKQVVIFAIGLIGLQLVSLILELVLMTFMDVNSIGFLFYVNLFRYLIIAVAIACVCIGSFSSFKNSFTKWYPYLIGLGAVFVIYGFNLIYGNFINLIYPTTSNDNQVAAESLMIAYPIACLFLFSFIAPFVEEMTYRVGLFTCLCRIKKWVAYVVSIIVFALIHFNFFASGSEMINELLNLPLYMFSGAVFCVLYDFFGLSASLTCHVSNNLFSLLLTLLLHYIK